MLRVRNSWRGKKKLTFFSIKIFNAISEIVFDLEMRKSNCFFLYLYNVYKKIKLKKALIKFEKYDILKLLPFLLPNVHWYQVFHRYLSMVKYQIASSSELNQLILVLNLTTLFPKNFNDAMLLPTSRYHINNLKNIYIRYLLPPFFRNSRLYCKKLVIHLWFKVLSIAGHYFLPYFG